MRAQAVTRWFAGGLLIAGVALLVPTAAIADDAKANPKHEQQLQSDAKQLDAQAARVASTADGQRRLNERLAKQFNVDASVVAGLRERHFSYGQATIALALSQQLMKQDTTLSQQAALDKILAERQAGKGWGVIAHEFDLKLGGVVSEVKKADKAVEQAAGKPDRDGTRSVVKVDKPEKAEKPDKPEKPDKIEKLEKIDRPAKPERPGR